MCRPSEPESAVRLGHDSHLLTHSRPLVSATVGFQASSLSPFKRA